MLGKTHTDEEKAKMSVRFTTMWQQRSEDERAAMVRKRLMTRSENGNHNPQSEKRSWKAGWREVGGQTVYFRSRWEANYARYLEWMRLRGEILSWQHEPHTFWFDGIKRGCLSYLPDFCVTELDGREVYHEVKGWMDENSATRIKRMRIYHPTVQLIVIDARCYKQIRKELDRLIDGWEMGRE